MRREKQPGQTKGEREADDPATAKQKTVAMISRRKCYRRERTRRWTTTTATTTHKHNNQIVHMRGGSCDRQAKNCGDDLEEEVRQKGEDMTMDDDDGDNNAQTQQSNSTHERGEEDGGGGDDTGDDESLEGVAAVSLMPDAHAS
jgi:hypothetical protein